jgi:hypothetical protein
MTSVNPLTLPNIEKVSVSMDFSRDDNVIHEVTKVTGNFSGSTFSKQIKV